jgi:hypothetical protein
MFCPTAIRVQTMQRADDLPVRRIQRHDLCRAGSILSPLHARGNSVIKVDVFRGAHQTSDRRFAPSMVGISSICFPIARCQRQRHTSTKVGKFMHGDPINCATNFVAGQSLNFLQRIGCSTTRRGSSPRSSPSAHRLKLVMGDVDRRCVHPIIQRRNSWDMFAKFCVSAPVVRP